jgi:hypothetical protein
MGPQESAIAIAGRPADGVEFMVSHDRTRDTGLTHGADRPQHLPLFRAAVNEVTDENHPPRRMPERALDIGISELPQQAVQSIGVAVNVADKVVSLFDQSLSFLPDPEIVGLPQAPFLPFICGSEPS